MASQLRCKVCGKTNQFGDKQPMRKFCDDECERVYEWLHGKGKGKPKEAKEGDAEDPEKDLPELDPKGKKALTRCRQFLLLAVDESTTDGERSNAAMKLCKLLMRHNFLQRVEAATEAFTVEDFMRWAERVARERGAR